MYSFPNLEPVCFSIFGSNCCLLTCIQTSQKAGQLVWYSFLLKNFPKFVVIYTVNGFSVINKAIVDVFLLFSCFFYDPRNVGNLISGSSTFSKSSLNIHNFSVHILLKSGLENFEHVRWVQLWGSLNILWYCPSLGLEWKLTFPSPVATAELGFREGFLKENLGVGLQGTWLLLAGDEITGRERGGPEISIISLLILTGLRSTCLYSAWSYHLPPEWGPQLL